MPWVRPIGVCEVATLSILRDDTEKAADPYQLCAGQVAFRFLYTRVSSAIIS